MRLRHRLILALLALVAIAATASAQAIPPACPECDEDGEPDESWYSSVDTGIISDEGGVLSDSDASVGENEHGRFTWFQYCLKFFDALGNHITLTYEAFVSEDGADIDASVSVNGEEVDLEDTLIGDLDDQTWGTMGPLPADLPADHTDLPPGVDVDECVYPDELGEVEVQAEATATCEVLL